MPAVTAPKIRPVLCDVEQIISFDVPLLQTNGHHPLVRPEPELMPASSTPLLTALVRELFAAPGEKVYLKICVYDQYHLQLEYRPSKDEYVFKKIEEAIAKAVEQVENEG